MTRIGVGAFTALVTGLSLSGLAQAALYDRGGGLIYDSVLNVTWLQNANYGAGSAYDDGYDATDGRMSWHGAVAWATSLSYYDSVRDQTLMGWRLPKVGPINGTTFNYTWSYDGSADGGYYISAPGTAYAGASGSELAYMYYNNLLGNVPYCSIARACPQPGWTSVVSPKFVDAASGETKAFQNLQSHWYWSGTPFALYSGTAWEFGTSEGSQNYGVTDYDIQFAWAVRPGDVPLPGAGLLLASALAGLGFSRRRAH